MAFEPGILGAQFFYVNGLQIYNYKKDFPKLEIGDLIKVSGELALSSNERRLKTKKAEDIQLFKKEEAPQATRITCDKINEEYVGQLISVTGEVVERKGSTFFLDDGTDEVKVYIKNTTGINAKTINEGENISVSGILNLTSSGVRLLPRSRNDIIKKDIESQETGQVLGEIETNDEWEIAQRDKKLELFKYILIIALAVIIILVTFLVKLSKEII